MERWDVIYKTLAAASGAITGYFFGGWPVLLGVLVAFVSIDYITGYANQIVMKIFFRVSS